MSYVRFERFQPFFHVALHESRVPEGLTLFLKKRIIYKRIAFLKRKCVSTGVYTKIVLASHMYVIESMIHLFK